MPASPYPSDDLNRVVEAGDDPNCTVDVQSLKPGQVVEIAFDGADGEKVGFSFRVAHIDVVPGQMGADACGPFTEVNLREADLNYLRKQGIAEPRPGTEVRVGDACSWNPGAPLGITMVHFGHITVGRWLIWMFEGMEGWCLDIPVKSIKVTPAR